MRFVSVLVIGGALASLSFPSFAQSTPASDPSAAQTAPAQPAAPATQQTPAPLQLHDLPPDPHTPTAEEKAEQQAAEQSLQIRRLAAAQNNWGQANSAPGMSLTLKETGRTPTPDGVKITYQLQGTGFTPDLKLSLLRWPLNQNVETLMDGITVNAAGTAICEATAGGSCSKTTKPGAPIEVTATLAKGEALRVALIAPDKKHGAAVALVPFPIAAEDKGCKLQAIRGSKNNELVLIKGEGFTTTDTFVAGSESFGEKHPITAKPNPDGHFVVALTPWVTGHDSGDTVVYAQNATCSPTLSFHWGKDSYKAE
jgi:hypothetical protein